MKLLNQTGQNITGIKFAIQPGNLLSTGTYWIGLRFSTIHKKLKWVDLTDPTFLNFLPGDPDDIKKDEDCVQIVGERPDYDGAWNAVNCSTKQSFICKKAAYPGAFNTITVPPFAVGSLSNACGPQWIYNSLDSFCYQVVLYKPKTFADAQWACQQMGGNLASITGPREQRFIQAILSTEQYQREAKKFWIGGSDGTREGGWGWIDGSPFAYLNWHPGQPNDLRDSPLGQDCAEMVAIWNYQWNDNRCDTEQYYICKKPAMPLTTTVLTPTAGPVDTCVSEAMISGNYSLLDGDKALTATTSKDGAHGPFNSRLFYHGANKMGWSPKRSTQSEYIQAYFYNIINFKGIITAGNAIGAEWVTSYRLRYQYSSFSEWVWYEEPPGKTKIFTGNSDNVTPVTNEIKFPFQAKYIRLYPMTWYGHVSLRWEILGCVHEFCLADYAISGPLIAPDIGLTASTSVDNQHLPSFSRLRPISPQTPVSCWKPNLTDKSAYIQVDIGSIQIIRGITVAGNPNAQEWVSSFKVLYGIKYNKVTSYYQEPYHTVKIFSGNVNNNETVTYYFKGHFQARFIRIEPESYHAAIALRFDVMVCPQGCNQRTLFDEVNDDQFSASSSANEGSFSPSQSRLNTGRTWQPSKNNNQTQWIQVDLLAMIQITALATQGRSGQDEWVTQYKMSYSQDGVKFVMYKGLRTNVTIFPGNFDDSSVRKVYLKSPFVARFMRIYPINYHKKMSLRWEIYGCPGPDSGRLIGCYADDGLSRDLPFEPYADPFVGMWPPMCIHHCFTKGYYYAGLQNRYLCYCGNSYGKYGSSKSCNQPCFYRPHYRCGGRRANSVYTTGLSPVTKICPPKWKEYQDKCYLLVFNMSTWIKARQDCRVMGSDLVTVNSQTEQDLVYSLMSNNFSAIFGFSGGGGVISTERTNINAPRKREGASDVWIGLNDKQEQNYFEWVNGELTKYTNWNVNQPATFNGVKENCVLINRTNGGWQDQNCDEKHHYLCMRAKMGSSKPTEHPQFPGCDIGWVGFRQSCYLFMDHVRVFLGAKFTCRGMGATLVQVDDRFEQAFLSSILSQKFIGLYWTDATDSKGTGTFVYSNFGFIKNVMYTNWAPGRPGSGPSCVAMQTKTSSGLWLDTNCTTLAGAVCEKLGQGKTTPKPSITTPAHVPCPKGWYEINNYCYQVNNVTSSKGLSYMDADKDCRSQGASLASFHNSTDFNYLWRNYIVGADGNFWIGINALTLVNKQIKYSWTDRTPVNYENWAQGQPDYNKGSGDCGEVVTRSGLWNNNICSFHRNWICKIRKGQLFGNTTGELQTPTKTPTHVPPTNGTPSTINGSTPLRSEITRQTTRISQTMQYTGPMTSPQTSPKSHVVTTGGIIGVVTAVIIVLALPTIGIILWRKKKSWTSGSIGFDNFTYRNDGGILTSQENTETNS